VTYTRPTDINIPMWMNVGDEAWGLLPKGALAPPAAVGLDLLESGDPRHWISAENLIGADG
jgi:hypothetical protein